MTLRISFYFVSLLLSVVLCNPEVLLGPTLRSGFRDFQAFGPDFLFAADHLQKGTEVHITDGTLDGTSVLLDANPGFADGYKSRLATVTSERFLFVGNNGVGENSLFVGFRNGTFAKLLSASLPNSNIDITILGTSNGQTLFVVYDGDVDNPQAKWWRTDGTVGGTVTYGAAHLPYGSGYLNYPVVCNTQLYFKACPNYTCGLFAFDGAGAPYQALTLAPDAEGGGDTSPSYLVCLNDQFVVFAGSLTGLVGTEIVAYNTTADTAQEIDVATGAASSFPAFLTVWSSAIYFLANVDSGMGVEAVLWATNVGSTWQAVTNVNEGFSYLPMPISDHGRFYTTTQGWLFFVSTHVNGSRQLMRVDTSNQTSEYIMDLPFEIGLEEAGPSTKILLGASLPSSDSLALVVLTIQGDLELRLLESTGQVSNQSGQWYSHLCPLPPGMLIADLPWSNIMRFTSSPGSVVFNGWTQASGSHLVKFEPSTLTTSTLYDAEPGSQTLSVEILGPVANKADVLLAVSTTMYGLEPYVLVNGSMSSVLLADLNPGCASSLKAGSSSSTTPVLVFGGDVVFPATTPTSGTELYVANGTRVQLLKDFYPGVQSSNPKLGCSTSQYMLVLALSDESNETSLLWAVDLSATAAQALTNASVVGVQFITCHPSSPVAFFLANANTSDLALWTTQGSLATTQLLPWSYGVNYSQIVIAGIASGHLWLTAVVGPQTDQFNVLQTVNVDTLAVTTLATVSTSSTPHIFEINSTSALIAIETEPSSYGNELYLAHYNEGLARFDLSLVADLNPGTTSSYPGRYAPSSQPGEIFFTAISNGSTSATLFKYLQASNSVQPVSLLSSVVNSGVENDTEPATITISGNLQVTDNGVAVFTVIASDTRTQLWMTDGSTNGTRPLIDLQLTDTNVPSSIHWLPLTQVLVWQQSGTQAQPLGPRAAVFGSTSPCNSDAQCGVRTSSRCDLTCGVSGYCQWSLSCPLGLVCDAPSGACVSPPPLAPAGPPVIPSSPATPTPPDSPQSTPATPEPTPSPDAGGSAIDGGNTGAIVGGIVGGLVGVGAAVLIVLLVLRRRNAQSQTNRLSAFLSLPLAVPIPDDHPFAEFYKYLVTHPTLVRDICVATPITEADDLTKALVVVFEAAGAGRATLLIHEFVVDEVRGCEEVNTLFRTNSIATKLLKSFTQLTGSRWLASTLGPLIDELAEKKLSLEVDPDKPDYDQANVALLQHYCQSVLDSLISQIDTMPEGIRQACADVFEIVGGKFTDAKLKAVGGILVLRWICAAIVAPDGFGVVTRKIGKDTRRALTLISKVIQTLANEVRTQKEAYLADMNKFIGDNIDKMRRFLATVAVQPNYRDGAPVQRIQVFTQQAEGALKLLHWHVASIEEKLKTSQDYPQVDQCLGQLGREQPTKEARDEARTLASGGSIQKPKKRSTSKKSKKSTAKDPKEGSTKPPAKKKKKKAAKQQADDD